MKQPSAPASFRTRFANDIVAEVMFPEKQTGKVAIIALGVPSAPCKKETLRFFAAHGYIVIIPRYRGTWESEGRFLERSPAFDIRDVVLEVAKKCSLKDLSTQTYLSFRVSAIHLFGTSFGGPAVLLNTRLAHVQKVVALSPVIDWSAPSRTEPFPRFISFTREAFGEAYRPRHITDWQKLIKTDFYNPVDHISAIDGRKVFILHAKDDSVVPYVPLLSFVEKTGAACYLKPRGGHLSLTHLQYRFYWKKLEAFLNS